MTTNTRVIGKQRTTTTRHSTTLLGLTFVAMTINVFRKWSKTLHRSVSNSNHGTLTLQKHKQHDTSHIPKEIAITLQDCKLFYRWVFHCKQQAYTYNSALLIKRSTEPSYIGFEQSEKGNPETLSSSFPISVDAYTCIVETYVNTKIIAQKSSCNPKSQKRGNHQDAT